MIIFDEIIENDNLKYDVLSILNDSYAFADFTPKDVCFFDIETTGLSADISSVYLIGCAYLHEDHFRIKQWFANDTISESSIIQSFLSFILDYKLLVHYNGSTFDVPYLQKKCKSHKIDCNIKILCQLDLYSKFRHYKKLFPTSNLKQKTMEEYIQIHRLDSYDGGELIHVYSHYMQNKYLRKASAKELLPVLLLHNKEDITGLMQITALLSLTAFLESSSFLPRLYKKNQILFLEVTSCLPFPTPLTISKMGVRLTTNINIMRIEVPIQHELLRHFYPNTKDYYYLPNEEMIIHKSVAQYVTSNYREKATKENCFVAKEGDFVISFHRGEFPSFRRSYSDKTCYLELTEEFLTNAQYTPLYFTHIMQWLLK